MRAAQAAGVEDDTVVWAERVLRSRNDKPLSQKIQEVVRSAGAGGDAVLKTAPTFPSTVVDERGGVSHPGVGKSLDAANRYWNSEVLTWIAATPSVDRCDGRAHLRRPHHRRRYARFPRQKNKNPRLHKHKCPGPGKDRT